MGIHCKHLKMERYANKIVVVTGASAGIGAAIVKKLLQNKMRVVGFARRKELIEDIGNGLPEFKQHLYALQVDITKESQIQGAFTWISNHLGPISAVINNAGVLIDSNVIDGSFENWKAIIDTNLLGVAVICREAIKIMRDNNVVDGYIINVNSFLGHEYVSMPHVNVYTVSKHALTALTKCLRVELIKNNCTIRISSLSPGLVDTNMKKNARVPEGLPILQVDDIADAVIYILGTRSGVEIEELTVRAAGEIY